MGCSEDEISADDLSCYAIDERFGCLEDEEGWEFWNRGVRVAPFKTGFFCEHRTKCALQPVVEFAFLLFLRLPRFIDFTRLCATVFDPRGYRRMIKTQCRPGLSKCIFQVALTCVQVLAGLHIHGD